MKPLTTLDLPPKFTHAFESCQTVKGRMQAHVVNRKGEIIKSMPWQDNLILDQGMNNYANSTWAAQMAYCVAGTGTTPTRDILDGTASQSGTTVTLSGSSYTFSGGDVGKWIGWDAGGHQGKITAFIDTSNVTVDRSQTVSAAAAKLYRANQTGLATEVKRTNTYPVFTYTDGRGASASWGVAATGVLTLRRTYDFSAEVGSVNYTEIGISPVATVASNLFARILLAGTVTVTSGQQLRITYELAITCAGFDRPTQTLTSSAGWPYTYNIISITGNGTSFTVTTSIPHHYVAGGSITIAGAKRVRFSITAATSTGSEFTLTTSASHGLAPGDSIEIEGVSPSGYNGTWIAGAGTTGSTIVVITTANPGTGTVFGNVRQTEPVTWYNGTWTIASVGASTIVVASAITAAAGADGTARNNLNATFYLINWPITPLGGTSGDYGVPVSPDTVGQWGNGGSWTAQNNGGGDGLLDGTCGLGNEWVQNAQLYGKSSALTTPGSFPASSTYAASGGTAYSASLCTLQSYTTGNFYRDRILEWGTGSGNAMDIRALCLTAFSNYSGASLCNMAWFFEQPQRKDSTHRLRITYRQTWSRTLA